MVKHYLLALLLALGFRPAFAVKYFVAPTGLDTNSGTITAPFLTIQRAQTAVSAGDTVYIRGGTYLMQNSQISGHSTAAAGSYAYITYLTKSGTAAARINYWAYPGEQPVFNYANVNPNVTDTNTTANPTAVPAPYRLSAFEVTGAYLYLRGLEIVGLRVPLVATTVNTLSICVSQSGQFGNNIFERLSMHDGQAIGFYLTRGPNNLILNCDAYRNNDNVNTSNTTGTAGGGNVDGFGNHPNNATYTGNVFRGCRAWQNSDDGYDCISAFAATTFENCWAFYNGYTQNFVSRGDGNGFKAGGYGTATTFPAVIPNNTTQFCVSVRNKANGFYSNHHQAGSFWYNNTAYQNAINYNMVNRKDKTTTGPTAGYLVDVDGYDHVLRNNVSLLARSTSATTRDISAINTARSTVEYNTFPATIGTNNIAVATSDFIGLDTTLLRSPRQADGSLPIIPTLRLAPGSGLIDAGTSTGFPAGHSYNGTAPDLGAYEFATLWTGALSTDWFIGGNWSGGVPAASTDALIPIVASNRYPLVSAGAAVARALTVSTGATLSQSGGTLSLGSDLTNNGTWTATGGALAISGGTSQTLGGSSPLAVQGLTIGSGGATLGTPTSFQGALTLLGNLTTNGQKLTLLSRVSGGVARDGLVVNSGGVVTGNVTVQRAIDPSLNAGAGYRQYSAPVSNATVGSLTTSGFTPTVNSLYNSSPTPGLVSPFPTVYGYNQARVATATSNMSPFDKGWASPAGLNDPLEVGRGYTVNIGAGETVAFVGPLNNGDKTMTLTRNGAASANVAASGWQLLGNPYPAPLDLSLIAGGDRVNLKSAFYISQTLTQYTGQYRAYTNGMPSGAANAPVLPVGQAFFVQVADGQTSGSLTFRNAQRLTTPATAAFQRPAADPRPELDLTLRGSGPASDLAVVYFEAGATAGVEDNYDALKLANTSGLNLGTLTASSQALAIDGRPLPTTTLTIPLQVYVPVTGSYTLRADQLLNLGGLHPYLRDVQLGKLVDLTQQPSYAFTQNAAFLGARFELVFSPQVLAALPIALAQQVLLYPTPARTTAYLELPASLGSQAVTATLVDAMGRSVRTSTLPAQGAVAHQLSLAGLPTGVYALRLGTSAGVVVKRLVVE